MCEHLHGMRKVWVCVTNALCARLDYLHVATTTRDGDQQMFES